MQNARIEQKQQQQQQQRTDLNAESAQAVQEDIRLCELEHRLIAENINLATARAHKMQYIGFFSSFEILVFAKVALVTCKGPGQFDCSSFLFSIFCVVVVDRPFTLPLTVERMNVKFVVCVCVRAPFGLCLLALGLLVL